MKSELGKVFMKLWHLCDKAEKAADKFAAKAGAQQYYPVDSAFAGGVACVSFESGKPPRPNVWRSIGKDADGIEMWVPDVKMRMMVQEIEDETKIPNDTATRIYKKEAKRKPNGQVVCFYTELYRDDEAARSANKRKKLSLAAKESFRIEKERLKLPVVTTTTVLNTIGADLTGGKGSDGKPHVVRPVTPTFFRYSQSIYLCSAYQCHAEGMTEISIGEYAEMQSAAREAERGEES
jgi:hypothetical protein